MSGARLIESLQHIHQAATDACGFIEGMTEADFLADKHTKQAVVMSLIIAGEAATHSMTSLVVTPSSLLSKPPSRGEACAA